jgi:hypothetical protein
MQTIKRFFLLLFFCSIGFAACAIAKQPRSSAVKAEFQRANPCPANGGLHGACPGYIKDHIIPLCAGGPDRASNMQWQTVEDAKVKDRAERRMCKNRS